MSKVIDNIEDIASIDNHIGLSGITAYHLLQGNVSLSNEVITNGFSTTLYTGNGSTQSINTGIDMDTQWGNDASEKFGGLVWGKGRNYDTSHMFVDTVRGAGNEVYSNLINAQGNNTANLSAFTTTGFSVGNSWINTSAKTYASWNFQTTHRVSGTTNHGKAYTCHYNPYTGFTIVKYEGSGIAGHEIPHHLGRKLGFYACKVTSTTNDWIAGKTDSVGNLNTTIAFVQNTGSFATLNDDNVSLGTSANINASANTYILYGWANSYFDDNNKLIGNYEIGTYQGTGASGNKVVTRGKPAWLMVKRLDAVSDWSIFDNLRTFDKALYANGSVIEDSARGLVTVSDGFMLNTTNTTQNASGGQYLFLAVYDNDSASGKSKYPRATDTTQIQLNNAIVPLPNGIDTNGVKVSTVSKNETVTGVTLTQGKNYLRWEN